MDPRADLVRHTLIESTASRFALLLLKRSRDEVRHWHQERDAAAERFEKLTTIECEAIKQSLKEFVPFD